MTTTVRSNADGSSTILVGATPAIEIAVGGSVSFPQGGGGVPTVAFRAINSGVQSVTAGVWTRVALASEQFDTAGALSADRFQPSVAGYYQFSGEIYFKSSGMTYAQTSIYKNGVTQSGGNANVASATDVMLNTSTLLYLNGTTDYVELYGYLSNGATPVFSSAVFSGILVAK